MRASSSTTSDSSAFDVQILRPVSASRHGRRARRGSRSATGVRARVRLGHAERHVQVAGRRPRQERLLQPVVAEPHDRVEPEDREVQRRAPVHRRAAPRDLVEDDGGVGDPAAAAAVLLGERDPDPAALRHARVEVPREAVLPIAGGPVLVVEGATGVAHRLRDQSLVVIEQVVAVRHGVILPRRTAATSTR